MITATGKFIDGVSDGAPAIEDIVAGLARINRYAGAIWCPLLAHSVLVAEMSYRKAGEKAFAKGLLHDACEVVMGDIPFPFKKSDQQVQENDFSRIIDEQFGLVTDSTVNEAVHWADKRSLVLETSVLKLPNYKSYQEYHWHHFEPMTRPEEVLTMSVMTTYRYPEMVLLSGEGISRTMEAIVLIDQGHYAEARAVLMECVLPEDSEWRDWR